MGSHGSGTDIGQYNHVYNQVIKFLQTIKNVLNN